MNFRKSFFVLVAASLSLFALSGCGKAGNANDPLAFFPASVDIVGSFDYAGDVARKNLKALAAKFPDSTKFKQDFLDGFNSEIISQDLNVDFEKDIQPIVSSKWEAAFAFDVEAVDPASEWKGEGVYAAIYFENIKAVEAYIKKTLAKDQKFLDPEGDDLADWYLADNGSFIAKSGNTILIAAEKDSIEQMIRVSQGKEDATKMVNSDPEAFIHLQGDFSEVDSGQLAIWNQKMQGYEGAVLDNSLSDIDKADFVVYAEKKGIHFKMTSSLREDLEENKLFSEDGAKAAFLKTVPVADPFVYFEVGSALSVLEPFTAGFNSVAGVISEEDSLDSFLASLSDYTGTDVEDGREFFDSPIAFVFSDVGSYIPGLGVYLKFDDESKATAEAYQKSMDVFVDAMIVELDNLLATEGSKVEGLFVRDAVVVDGAGLHKVYLDWSKMPPEMLAQTALVPGLNEMKLEFYYGITKDNVFVAALYPEFDKAYAKETMAKSKNFKAAQSALDLDASSNMVVMSFKPLQNILDRYIDMAKQYGEVSETELADYEQLKSWMNVIKYFAYFIEKKGANLKTEGFISIEENSE